MTRVVERRKAIELRKKGKTYREIRLKLGIAKSSLSEWLRDIPLSESQVKRIKGIRRRAVEKYRQTMRLKREKRYEEYYHVQKKKWFPFTKREEFLAGLFLYWGEGNKVSRCTVSINNTDPAIVKYGLYWMVKCLEVSKKKVRVQVHLYSDMNVKREIRFWSKELGLGASHFCKPYIKRSLRSDVDQKGFSHGTCAVSVHKTEIKENILMAIKAAADTYSEKIAKI